MANILFIAQRVPFPPNKGEKLRSYHQIEYLCRIGHHVTVFSPVESDTDEEFANQLSDKLGVTVVTKPLAHKFVRFAAALLTGRAISEANFFSRALFAQICLHAHQADLIFCSASSLAKYVFDLNLEANYDKKPLLLMDFMDVDSDKWQQYAHSASWPMTLIYKREQRLIKALEAQSVAYFDAAFLIARAEYELFQTHVCKCDNLHILGNGIDQNEFKPHIQETENVHFLFTGVMDYKPNIDAVLWFVENCWPAICELVPHAHFTIAGMNPDAKIQALAKDSRIEITGFVDDIMPYFNRAQIFVAPFQIARGVQNKVLQAMSCALPVVSSPLGAEGIESQHNYDIVIADSPQAFISHCIALANNADLAADIGKHAHETIRQHYSWESVLAPLERIIKKGTNA
ncbi:TIGR03087 family PEP-CTERM/XrtA system glycosyltransferase [Glaciecola siphonariae]|uniref:TIGR03087 family PEP-CTERM/XrtA system glycosyltransferase n=1 Tax=Glaciecola siphonariae TaxID=521012 RepID=A0ABV9LUG7_9ALTE